MQGILCCKKRKNYDRHLKVLQSRILKHFLIKEKVKFKDIKIEIQHPKTKKKERTFIHSHIYPNVDKSKPTIIFIHGFGGSTATYPDFISYLTHNFSLISMDLLGMGCSGKPNINWITLSAEEIVEIFISSFEQFRIGLNLKKMNIIGHSLGAYFACLYANKYPGNVGKILAMSTPCFTHPPIEFDPKELKLNFKRKIMYYFWNFMNKRYVPGYFAFSSMPMKRLLRFWLKGRMDYSFGKKKAIIDYTSTMFWDRGFSCDIITGLMSYRGYTNYLSIAELLPSFSEKGLKLKFIFGSKDWLDYEQNAKYFENPRQNEAIEYKLVKGLGHQMPLLSPKLMAQEAKSYFET